MAGFETRWVPATLAVLAGTLMACAGGSSKPSSLPPQTMTEPPASAAEPSPVPIEGVPAEAAVPGEETIAGAPTTGDEAAAEPDDSLVLIESGQATPQDQPTSLAEAARAERLRRQIEPPAQIVITDKNLSQYAQGQLTVAEGVSGKGDSAAENASASPAAGAQAEAYWRQRARDIRQAWSQAAQQVEELEGEVFELRQRFYAEDDGFYRDSQIKPAWDRAIERLDAARWEVEARQRELDELMEEGRQAGALPGWLREGIELEPVLAEPSEPIHEPGEPEIYREDGSGAPP